MAMKIDSLVNSGKYMAQNRAGRDQTTPYQRLRILQNNPYGSFFHIFDMHLTGFLRFQQTNSMLLQTDSKA